MNEQDQLRAAMRATERPYRDSLDLTAIMRDGRRLRRRRRLAGGGAAALATVLVVVGVGIGLRWTRPPAPEQRPVPAATGPATHRPTEDPTPAPGATTSEPPPQPLGDVVDSSIRYGPEQRVFYFVAVDLPAVPGVTIGLVSGRRAAGGRLTSDFLVNDVQGVDRRAGFHQIGYDQSLPPDTRPPVPTFGYFVGAAKRIVGTADGRQVDARLARWSVDPDVVIFWFDPAVLTPGVRLDGIVARDVGGRLL
ncbi:hypothetical protein [Micromonospora sp. NPDC092111]|uniref:hypothetical protein n=1 Tax=Micromonospora sp. NPDC092111 TaxID=3364289 RepID=UPI0038040142